MIPVNCRYCSTPLDAHGKPVREAGQLPPAGAELCFACGSVAVRAAGAARHCACPHCAEREFQTTDYLRDSDGVLMESRTPEN